MSCGKDLYYLSTKFHCRYEQLANNELDFPEHVAEQHCRFDLIE
jgi:hypothetical protein